MKALPDEGRPSPHPSTNNRHSPQKNNHRLAHHRLEIKKISKRLNAYAEGTNIPTEEVLRLLQDTRSQVLSLHIARKALRKNSRQKKSHRPDHPDKG